MIRFSFLIIFQLIGITSFLLAQEPITDMVYKKSIRTILMYKDGFELSYPVIKINSDEKVDLEFDDITETKRQYGYSVIHCNSDWTPSDISYSEYADGFDQNIVNDYTYSSNTIVSYIHYKLSLPNEECSFKLSGNYIVKVFDSNNPDEVVFTRRFFVYESVAIINQKFFRPSLPLYALKKQQFQLTVKPNISEVSDYYNEIEVLIYQNYAYDQCVVKPSVTFLSDNTLTFDNMDANLFNGLSEFRNFDTKSKKYQTINVKQIQYDGPYYSVYLIDDEDRSRKQYFFDTDLNGKFLVENSESKHKATEADYFKINFTLPEPEPFVDGDVYLFGALTNWQCQDTNKMIYDFDKREYKLSIMAKQGYYNYLYAYKTEKEGIIDLTYIEGSHYETDNDYLTFVYFKPMSERYHRLIGYRITNSQKQ
jgi:hypothetical protein